MIDWQLWQKGYVDCMANAGQVPASESYNAGHACAEKVKQELKRSMPWLNV